MSGSVYERMRNQRLAQAQEHLDGRYEGAKASAQLLVTNVSTNSQGDVELAYGTIEGRGNFSVPMRGRGVQAGDLLHVEYTANNPGSPDLTYINHIESDQAGAGITQADTSMVPAPNFASPPFVSGVVKDGQTIQATMTVNFYGIEERFGPVSYVVSYRITPPNYTLSDPTQTGPAWTDIDVPHVPAPANQPVPLGALQTVSLGRMPVKSTVEVKIRTRVGWASALGPIGLDHPRTFQAADGQIAAGGAAGLTVSQDTPGVFVLIPQPDVAAINLDAFQGWDYEISTTPSYAGIITIPANSTPHTSYHPRSLGLGSSYTFAGTPGQQYYFAVRSFSKTGTLGDRFPSNNTTNWLGPYTIPVAAPPPDSTPPPVWTKPSTVGEVVQFQDGTYHGYLTVTLPSGYAFPSDYRQTHVYITVSDGRIIEQTIPGTALSGKWEVGFGTFTVKVRGIDQSFNASAYSPTDTVVIPFPDAPGKPTITSVEQVGLALKINFTRASDVGGLAIKLERSPDNAGAPSGVWNTIYTGDATMFLDLFAAATDPGTGGNYPTYWYRATALNLSTSGAPSDSYAGQAQKLKGNHLVADSVTATQIVGDQAFFNKVMAGKILADRFMTANDGAVNPGLPAQSRLEMQGTSYNGGAGQLVAYQVISGTQYTRMTLRGDSLVFYNDNGTQSIVMGRDNATGFGYMTWPNAGLDLRNGSIAMDIGSGRVVRFYAGAYELRAQYVNTGNTQTLGLGFITGSNGSGVNTAVYFGHNAGFGLPTGLFVRMRAGDLDTTGYITTRGLTFNTGSNADLTINYTEYNMGTHATYGAGYGAIWAGATTSYAMLWNVGSTFVNASAQVYLRIGNAERMVIDSSAISVYNVPLLLNTYMNIGNLNYTDASGATLFVRGAYALTSSANSLTYLASFGATAGNGIDLRLYLYRPTAGTDWTEVRGRLHMVVDNNRSVGGYVEFGARQGQGFSSLGNGAQGNLLYTQNNQVVALGALVKSGGGSFVIDHPDPAKKDTHDVRHCFVESNTAGDNLYRWEIEAREDGEIVELPLQDYFPFLNRNTMGWANGADHWGRAFVEFTPDPSNATTALIHCEKAGRYNVLIIGERKDEKALLWWDRRKDQKLKTQEWMASQIVHKREMSLLDRELRDADPVPEPPPAAPMNGPWPPYDESRPMARD